MISYKKKRYTKVIHPNRFRKIGYKTRLPCVMLAPVHIRICVLGLRGKVI